ncbi:hypothetical protein MKX40_17820 [Paenibacillus sp. FSL R5-0517]|uniref:hypothetical protein n=1 Tax=Paenibacillus sp. FSL R5-0517 TaxID=2921647 RepID=UPI0030D6E82E
MDSKKGNIIFWSIIGSIVLLIGIAVLTKSAGGFNDASSDETDNKELTTYERFYHPSDYVINSLIRKGENLDEYGYLNYLKSFRLPIKENKIHYAKDYPPVITINTPRNIIVRESYRATQKMDSVTLDDMKSKIDMGDTLVFYTAAYRTIYDTKFKFHIVLRQGDLVLQPGGSGYTVDEVEHDVFYDGDSSTGKKYTREVGHAIFAPTSEFDYEKPFEVVFLYNGTDTYAVYELDLNNLM